MSKQLLLTQSRSFDLQKWSKLFVGGFRRILMMRGLELPSLVRRYFHGHYFLYSRIGTRDFCLGISANLPGSENLEEIKTTFYRGNPVYKEEENKWNVPHPEVPKTMGLISGVDNFDHAFFGR